MKEAWLDSQPPYFSAAAAIVAAEPAVAAAETELDSSLEGRISSS